MQVYNAKDMARSFRTVRDNTIKIAEEIPEEQYAFRPAPGSHSVAETLAHIAVATRFPQRLHGDRMTAVDFAFFSAAFPRILQQEAELTTKAQILDALRRGGAEFTGWLETLSDETLAERIQFPSPMQPPTKTRFEMLLASKEHEMHHRGQLMVIERMLGMVPHLTRDFEARRAQMQQQQQAGAGA
ncbi:MAG: DinB family protein [Acidobacteriia bacterium]|nr:DinB family protein [Terriglobia bacterium]